MTGRHIQTPSRVLINRSLKHVDIVCVNLNPERVDTGGLCMMAAGCNGGQVVLSLPSQYDEYIEWERLGRPEEEAQIKYWAGRALLEIGVYGSRKAAHLLTPP
jgi:hypothetical protein